MSQQTPAINPTTNELGGGDYQLGCAFLLQKDYKKAIHHFSEEIIRNPQNFDAFDGRARAHTELGNIPQAIEDYSQIIEQKQANTEMNVYLKRAYLYSKKLEEYEKAIADLNEYINNTPKERIVEKLLGLHERGSIYKKLKKYELACDDFSAVLELNPNHIDVRIDRATFFIMLGQLEKAIEDYSIIIASDPHPTPGVDLYIANSYLRRGMIYSDRNETEKAFHDYSECIKIDNKEMYAFFNRGCISMLNRKNMKEAIEDFTRVLALDPLSHKAMYFRGACYAEVLDFPKALKDLENALRICPSSVKYQEVYERCTLMAKVSTLLNITNGNNNGNSL